MRASPAVAQKARDRRSPGSEPRDGAGTRFASRWVETLGTPSTPAQRSRFRARRSSGDRARPPSRRSRRASSSDADGQAGVLRRTRRRTAVDALRRLLRACRTARRRNARAQASALAPRACARRWTCRGNTTRHRAARSRRRGSLITRATRAPIRRTTGARSECKTDTTRRRRSAARVRRSNAPEQGLHVRATDRGPSLGLRARSNRARRRAPPGTHTPTGSLRSSSGRID